MTDYVATRWNRVEILLRTTMYGVQVYKCPIGCIFDELLWGKPMIPYTSTLIQINKVLKVTGKPSKEEDFV